MLNEYEKQIVGDFYTQLPIVQNKQLKLLWDNCEIIAIFDTCFDDYNQNDEDDEYTSFAFQLVSIIGNPPIEISKDNYFIINYHNFPNKIEVIQ